MNSTCNLEYHVFNFCSGGESAPFCRECDAPNPDYVGKFQIGLRFMGEVVKGEIFDNVVLASEAKAKMVKVHEANNFPTDVILLDEVD